MQQVLFYGIFGLFLVCQYVTGRMIVLLFFKKLHPVLAVTASILSGVVVSVPLTYVFSLLFAGTDEPIFYGVLTCMLLCTSIWFWNRRSEKGKSTHISIDNSAILLVISSFVFSWWIMAKTFHAGAAGELFVGSNNVFDFGHALGIVRSFSWGGNIPFSSPFGAGLPFFYHFFFYFWVGIWEYFGVPIVWATNITSAVSFWALLIMVYFLPQVVAGQGRLVGWLTVALTITHSTLGFWHLLAQKGLNLQFFRFLWQLPTYPFAGPFDGSMISIFMTLNSYVNQRHLAFASAFGLFLIMGLVQLAGEKKLTPVRYALLGAFVGLIFMWNISICIVVAAIMLLFFLFEKKWKGMMFFSLAALCIIIIYIIPYSFLWKDIVGLFQIMALSGSATSKQIIGQKGGLLYLWENLGLLPFVALAGYMIIPPKRRIYILPFVLLFVLESIYGGFAGNGFDQKFLSLLILGVNVLVAITVAWLWHKRTLLLRTLAVCIFFVLTISGFVDLIAIKNEFAFPLVDAKTAHVISWIRHSTPKTSVFVSYSDIIDPVALSGRKNFFGFFRNIVRPDRSEIVRRIYGGDISMAKAHDIDFILVPKQEKNDFPYTVDEKNLRLLLPVVFETDVYMILGVSRGMLK